MGKEFSIECPHCQRVHRFAVRDVAGLQKWVEVLVQEARDDSYVEGLAEGLEFHDSPSVNDLKSDKGPRVLRELAAAVRRGDLDEVRTQLKLVGLVLGADAVNEIELGWFDTNPHRPAMAGGMVPE